MALIKGIKNEKPKENMTLFQMAECLFDDSDVLQALKDYITSRRQQHNMPSKVAWQKQLVMLKNIEPTDRAKMVENSTLKGYRQIVYLDSYKPSNINTVVRTKSTEKRVAQEF